MVGHLFTLLNRRRKQVRFSSCMEQHTAALRGRGGLCVWGVAHAQEQTRWDDGRLRTSAAEVKGQLTYSPILYPRDSLNWLLWHWIYISIVYHLTFSRSHIFYFLYHYYMYFTINSVQFAVLFIRIASHQVKVAYRVTKKWKTMEAYLWMAM